MTESLRMPSSPAATVKLQESGINYATPSSCPSSLSTLDLSQPGELAVSLSTCVRLDWEDLECFEQVSSQFQALGVVFHNAIALRPSNPAYPPYSGSTVIMGAPKSGWLEATFLRPVQFVSGFVTSRRRTILTAFDRHNTPLAQAATLDRHIPPVRTAPAPNVNLSVCGSNIHRVIFQAYNSHLTLDDFCFSL